MPQTRIEENLESFLRHIDSIKDTLPMTLLLLEPHIHQSIDALETFMNTKAEKTTNSKGEEVIQVLLGDSKYFEILERDASVSALAPKIISTSLFVSLISQFDSFMNKLLQALYEMNPQILLSSDRNLSFSQLFELESIDVAREYLIEKEIESVLRKSHEDQFKYLETKLKIELRKLSIWGDFIEITERRNLIVHCDGVISHQYLKNCTDNSVDVSKLKAGDKLVVDLRYFLKAYECLYEISCKLTHTIWRKCKIEELEHADEHLMNLSYDLLETKSFKLADTLLEFAYQQKNIVDDTVKCIFIINAALSKYLQNDKESARKILDKKDWTSSSHPFKLAQAIILEDYDFAYYLMEKIGNDGEVNISQYKEWPLFSKIRNQAKFKKTFKSIFNEDYKVFERPKKPVHEIIMKRLKARKKKSAQMAVELDDASN